MVSATGHPSQPCQLPSGFREVLGFLGSMAASSRALLVLPAPEDPQELQVLTAHKALREE